MIKILIILSCFEDVGFYYVNNICNISIYLINNTKDKPHKDLISAIFHTHKKFILAFYINLYSYEILEIL